MFSRGFTKNGDCSLDRATYKSSSPALVSSSFVFHGFFACFPSPFIDGVSWIKYFKRIFVFDVSIPGQFLLSFALQRMSHPGKKHDKQVTAKVITSKKSRVTSRTNHIATKTPQSDHVTNKNQTIPSDKLFTTWLEAHMSVLFLLEMFLKARKAGEMILSPVPFPELKRKGNTRLFHTFPVH